MKLIFKVKRKTDVSVISVKYPAGSWLLSQARNQRFHARFLIEVISLELLLRH